MNSRLEAVLVVLMNTESIPRDGIRIRETAGQNGTHCIKSLATTYHPLLTSKPLDYGNRDLTFLMTPLTLLTILSCSSSSLLLKDCKVSETGQPGSATAPTQRLFEPLTPKSCAVIVTVCKTRACVQWYTS